MNRTEKKSLIRRKRRRMLLYATSSVLTVGIMIILAWLAVDQSPWSWAWCGLWVYVAYQMYALVIHFRELVAAHHEHEELIERFRNEQAGGRHEA